MRIIFSFLVFSFGLTIGTALHSAGLAAVLAFVGIPLGWGIGARIARKIKGV